MTTTTILSDNGVSSGSAGIKTTGGNDGTLQLQTTTSGGTATTALAIDTSQNVGIGTSSPSSFNPNATYNNVVAIAKSDQVLTLGAYYQAGIAQSAFINASQFGTPSNPTPFVIQTGGTERMRIDTSGNVGIGTSSPTAKLQIANNVGSAGAANQIRLYESGSSIFGLGISAGQFDYRGTAHVFYSDTGTERMRINSSGNVGIGTSSPTSKLHVYGDTVTATIESTANSDGNIRFKNSGAWYTVGMLGFAGATDLSFFDNNAGAERAKINTSGQFFTMDGAGNVKAAYAARAWVNFNGTGTIAIRASGNVTSLTDNGTGDYTVNLTTAMSDTNYSVVTATGIITSGWGVAFYDVLQTTSFKVITRYNGSQLDYGAISAAAFR